MVIFQSIYCLWVNPLHGQLGITAGLKNGCSTEARANVVLYCAVLYYTVQYHPYLKGWCGKVVICAGVVRYL